MDYVLRFTNDEIMQVAAGVRELAFKVAQPILTSMQQQIDEQNAANSAAPVEPEAAPAQ